MNELTNNSKDEIRTRWEYLVATLLALTVIVLLIPSILSARKAVRDNIRKQDLATIKHGLEMYNNIHEHYGIPPNQNELCTHTNDSSSWLLGDDSVLLQESVIDAIPHDLYESDKIRYTYCATDIENSKAIGYYIQAVLETDATPETGFDQDEKRKFEYRILKENDDTLFRVCGGTETQCKPLNKTN